MVLIFSKARFGGLFLWAHGFRGPFLLGLAMAEIEAIGLELQTDGIDRGIKKLDELSRQGPKVEQAMDGIAQSGKRVLRSLSELDSGSGAGLKRTGEAAKEAATGINASGRAAREAVTDTESLRRAVSGLRNDEERFIRTLIDQVNALTMTRGEFAAYTAAQKGLGVGAQETARALGNKIDMLKAEKQALAEVEKANKSYSDVMSGVVTTVKALAGTFALGAFYKKFVTETINAEQEQAQLAAVLKSTGEAAGWTQQKLNDMASSMSKSSVFSAGEINQAQTRMLSYLNVVGQQFPKAMQATIDMAQRMGMSVTQSAETVGKALDVPSEGLTALTKQGFRFTEAQKLLVKQLEESGQTAEAQKIILSALESSYGGAAAAARDTFGGALAGLKNTVNDLMTGGGGSLDGLTGSVNELSNTLQSDETKQAFEALIGLMIKATNTAVRLANAMAMLSQANMGGALLDGASLDNPQSALVGVEARISRIQANVDTFNPNASGWKGARNKFNSIFWDDYEDSLLQLSIAEKQRTELLKKVGGEQYGDNAPDPALWNPEPVKAYGKALQDNTAWIKQYGTAAQKAALEIKEWEKKLGEPISADMKAQIEKKYADKAVDKKGIAEANKELKEQQKLINEMVGLKPDFMEDWNRLNKLYKDGQISLEVLTEWQAKLLGQQPALANQAKAAEEAEKEYRKYIDTLNKSAASIGDMADKQEAANATFGKSKIAIEQMVLAQKQLAAANAKDVGPWTQDQVDALTKVADEQERYVRGLIEAQFLNDSRKRDEELKDAQALLELQQYSSSLLATDEVTRNKLIAQRKSEIKLAKELAEIERTTYSDNPVQNWIRQEDEKKKVRLRYETETQTELAQIEDQYVQQQVQQYDQVFRQGFADMLNNGKDGWKSFTKSLVTTFKTTVADQIYKMFAQPFVVKLVASLLGVTGTAASTAASAASGGSNVLSMASSATSLFGAGGLAGSMMAGAGWLTGATTFGGALSAGASLVGTGTLAGFASGIGMIAGALGPIALGVAALMAIIGKDDSGTPHTGSVGSYNATTGYQQVQNGLELGDAGIDMGMYYGGAERAKISETVARGIVGVLDGLDQTFGGAGGFTVTTGFADDSSKDGAWGGLRIIGSDGQDLINWDDERTKWAPREFSNGEEGLQEYLNAVAVDTRKVMMDSMDLPNWAKEIVSSVDESDFDIDALQAVVTQIAAVQAQLTAFGNSIKVFGDLSIEAQGAIMEAAGGIDALSESMSSYYQNFYSDDERKQIQRDQINEQFDVLGLDHIDFDATDAREQFRALVEEQMKLANGIPQEFFESLTESLGSLDSESFSQSLGETLSGMLGDAITPEQEAAIGNVLSGIDGLSGLDAESFKDGLSSLLEMNAGALGLSEEGAKTAAALLGMSSAFADVTTSSEEAAAAIKAEAEAQKEAALSAMGLSVDSLVSGFLTEVNEGRGASAGAWLADTIAAGFEQAIYGQAIEIIMNSIIDGVITPVVTAAMTGAVVSEAVSDAAIETMVANARAAAEALNVLLNDPEFKKAMDSVLGIVKDLGNSIGASIPKMSTYKSSTSSLTSAYTSATSAADSAAEAAKKLADQWKSTIDSMSDEMKRLRGELLGDSDDSGMAYYESLFAIKTAQARAGDQDAADELPSIIQALEELAKGTAGTKAEVLLMQSAWLDSLTTTRDYLANQYGVDIGNEQSSVSGATTAAAVIKGSANTAVVQALQSSSDNPALLAELKALRVALEKHDANRSSEAIATVPAIQEIRKTVRQWNNEGLPEEREAV